MNTCFGAGENITRLREEDFPRHGQLNLVTATHKELHSEFLLEELHLLAYC